jgi:hypothetical protein
MVDFADGVSDDVASQRLKAALQGRGAFRRFKNQIYEHHPALISPWQALRDVRAQRRAVEWLLDQGPIDDRAARQFAGDHPDRALSDQSQGSVHTSSTAGAPANHPSPSGLGHIVPFNGSLWATKRPPAKVALLVYPEREPCLEGG